MRARAHAAWCLLHCASVGVASRLLTWAAHASSVRLGFMRSRTSALCCSSPLSPTLTSSCRRVRQPAARMHPRAMQTNRTRLLPFPFLLLLPIAWSSRSHSSPRLPTRNSSIARQSCCYSSENQRETHSLRHAAVAASFSYPSAHLLPRLSLLALSPVQNKVDLFRSKLREPHAVSALTAVFPDYNAGTDEEAALEFIARQFEEKNEFPEVRHSRGSRPCTLTRCS